MGRSPREWTTWLRGWGDDIFLILKKKKENKLHSSQSYLLDFLYLVVHFSLDSTRRPRSSGRGADLGKGRETAQTARWACLGSHVSQILSDVSCEWVRLLVGAP